MHLQINTCLSPTSEINVASKVTQGCTNSQNCINFRGEVNCNCLRKDLEVFQSAYDPLNMDTYIVGCNIWTNQTHNFSFDLTHQLVIRLTNNHRPPTQYTYWVPLCLWTPPGPRFHDNRSDNTYFSAQRNAGQQHSLHIPFRKKTLCHKMDSSLINS